MNYADKIKEAGFRYKFKQGINLDNKNILYNIVV